MTVKRDEKAKTLSGNITQPTTKSTGITVKDLPKNSKEVQLRNAWLKGKF